MGINLGMAFLKKLFQNNDVTDELIHPKTIQEEEVSHFVLLIEAIGFTSKSAGKLPEVLDLELKDMFQQFGEKAESFNLAVIPTQGNSILIGANDQLKEDEELVLGYYGITIRQLLGSVFKNTSYNLAISINIANAKTGELRALNHSYDLFGENGFIQRGGKRLQQPEYLFNKNWIDKGEVIKHFSTEN